MMRRKTLPWMLLVLLAAGLTACKFFTVNLSMAPTQTALQAEINYLLQTATALSALAAAPTQAAAPLSPDSTIEPPPVLPILTAAPVAAAPSTPEPTPQASVAPQPNATPVSPDDERALFAAARILLFEDMSASRHVRLIKQALDEAGYFYVDVGSAQGWFKTQLLSDIDWDVVIAGAEADRQFGGEFFGLIRQRVEGGASAIVETWNLDAAPQGQAMRLLDLCGLQVQADWYLPDPPVFFWTQPQAAVFTTPNRIPMLRNARSIWSAATGDMGDLLMLRASPPPPSDTLILASPNPQWNDHGLISSCLGGRVIIQTFRSHEYQPQDSIALWQNYVHQALQQRFIHTPRSLPTPGLVFPLSDDPSPVLRPGPTPGPDYTFAHTCGEALTARLLVAPRFSTDLFEHHAQGVFAQLRLELTNPGAEDIQVWAQDYRLDYTIGKAQKSQEIHKAATGFLFIEGGVSLWQTMLSPGQSTRVAVVFDIPAAAQNLILRITPGAAFSRPVCQVNIPLDK